LFLLPLFSGCAQTPDLSGLDNVQFTKTVFQLMADGNQGVGDHIDWEILRAGNQNVGQQYQAAKDDVAKSTLRHGFIFGFRGGFSRSGATVAMFSNWTQLSDDANWAVVSANGSGGNRIVFTLSKRDNKRRLAAIDLQFAPQRQFTMPQNVQ
jgi:hypothetical protein